MLKKLLSPPRFVFAANVACAALALIQGLIVARLLGPSGYGVIAILATLGGVAANFWDVRLVDLAIKQHYAIASQHDAPVALQTASMQLALLFNFGLAVLMFASASVLGALLWPWFTEQQPAVWWIVAQGLAIGGAFFVGSVQAMQRLTDDYYSFGLVRVATQLTALPITLAFLLSRPNLDGYYGALTSTVALNLAISLTVLAVLWRRKFGFSLRRRGMLAALPHYRGQMRFILSANVLSYSKMLTRSGDVLVLGFFASDAVTGCYRLARSLADGLSVVTVSLSQYYYPHFMRLLHEDNAAAVAAAIRRFVLLCGLATLVLMPAAQFGLGLVNSLFLKGAYDGLPLATALLMSSFIWTAGVHTWLWPVLVTRNQTHRMASWGMIGGLVQIGMIAALSVWFTPRPDLAALGSVAYYLLCYGPLVLWWRGNRTEMEAAA